MIQKEDKSDNCGALVAVVVGSFLAWSAISVAFGIWLGSGL